MGTSNQFHFDWLKSVIQSQKLSIRETLPERPRVLGIGEQRPSPFLDYLLEGIAYSYQATDLFAEPRSGVIASDLNDLKSLGGQPTADILCSFRSSYFIEDKDAFLDNLPGLLAPGAYVFMDFLIGSSSYPVIEFQVGKRKTAAIYDPKNPAVFKTTFFDQRLLTEFGDQVAAFCRHARLWPLATHRKYVHTYGWGQFLREVQRLAHLKPSNFEHTIRRLIDPKNLITLTDFESRGFQVVAFNSHYFYPEVEKFNLYNFVALRFA